MLIAFFKLLDLNGKVSGRQVIDMNSHQLPMTLFLQMNWQSNALFYHGYEQGKIKKYCPNEKREASCSVAMKFK